MERQLWRRTENAIVARALILLARPMVPLQYVFPDQMGRHKFIECVGEMNRSWLHMSCIVSLQPAWSLESCNTYKLADKCSQDECDRTFECSRKPTQSYHSNVCGFTGRL